MHLRFVCFLHFVFCVHYFALGYDIYAYTINLRFHFNGKVNRYVTFIGVSPFQSNSFVIDVKIKE